MTLLPVIEREMRAQARLGFTYTLRVVGAAALLFVCFYFWVERGLSPALGGLLFGFLNCTLFFSIWILVPLLAADCISRERREGTLGLLFLTPLKAREIVLSKSLVHGIRALTLWLAVLPVLTIAFLVGGVTWQEAVLSGLVNFSAICWALAAGVLASSVSKPWLRAMLLAAGLSACFGFVFVMFVGSSMMLSVRSAASFWFPFSFQYPNTTSVNWPETIWITGFFGTTDVFGWWGKMFGSLTPMEKRNWLLAEAGVALASILFLLTIILLAAMKLRRSWQEEPPSARQLRVQKVFCTPVIGVAFFHYWLRRKLERNPIGWLEQRTWTGRLVMWGWFAVMISFYSAVFSAHGVGLFLPAVQEFMAWGLLGVMAVSAAGSFQRERETRVLELLLVSPMSVGEIIYGRLRGLWGQFLPALLLMLGVWIYLADIFRERENFSLIPFFCGGFLTLPVIGLRYSLRRKSFIGAFLSTLFAGLLLPHLLKLLLYIAVQIFLGGLAYPEYEHPWLAQLYHLLERFISLPLSIVAIQLVIASRAGWRLRQDLLRRDFAFARATA